MTREESTGWTEADITINEQPLTFAESLSVRVAVSSYLMFVTNPENANLLGPIAEGYAMQLHKVLEIIHRGTQ